MRHSQSSLSRHEAFQARLAYLQRAGVPPGPIDRQRVVGPNSEDRLQFAITGVGRENTDLPWSGDRSESPPRMAATLTSLHTFAIPMCFTAAFQRAQLLLRFGTWTTGSGASLIGQAQILAEALAGCEPVVDLQGPTTPMPLNGTGPSGYILGLPTALTPTPTDPSGTLDRLLRSTRSAKWMLTVLAFPISEAHTLLARRDVLEESREIQELVDARTMATPMADQHRKMSDALIEHLTEGLRVGCWRTSVYITTHDAITSAYPVVASAMRSATNGAKSMPEPVRVFSDERVAELAAAWAMVDTAGRQGPGRFNRYYEYQTMLNSHQLAAYVQLPAFEVPGFTVRRHVRFDTDPGKTPDDPSIPLGRIQILDTLKITSREQARDEPEVKLNGDLRIGCADLTKHVFVAGVTGSGKTNTIIQMLKQVSDHGIPFLVIEPAKTEYRALISDHLIPKTTVYTVGRETVAPLRLNPFETLPFRSANDDADPLDGKRYDVAGHIDRLRSLFVASFGLWNPLPAILERALYQIYTDRGWDLRSGGNLRLGVAAEARLAFPVMTDLAAAVNDVILELGYDREIADNLRGALGVRVNSLLLGAKGRMLDTRAGARLDTLFEKATVIELEGLGDEDDKAFVMGLILIQLAEYRRSRGRSESLQGLLIVEEAHRLLRNVAERGVDENNAAAKAVESFGNLLAEIRAYGQGVVIADQVPTDLAPIVLKGTNLKIAHRLVSADDREAVGSTMTMSPAQIQHLATLPKGLAAVYAEGQDGPLLIRIEKVAELGNVVDDVKLKDLAAVYPSDCPGEPELRGTCCEYAENLLSSVAFRSAYSRSALSVMLGGSPKFGVSDLMDLISEVVSPGVGLRELTMCALGRAAQWFSDRRGAQYGWTFDQVRSMTQALVGLFVADSAGQISVQEVTEFVATSIKLHSRRFDPFPNCYMICADQTCMLRGSVIDALEVPRHLDAWRDAWEIEQEEGEVDDLGSLWDVVDDVGIEIAGLSAGLEVRDGRRSGSIRASLCFAQHALRTDDAFTPGDQRNVMYQLIERFGLGMTRPGPTTEGGR